MQPCRPPPLGPPHPASDSASGGPARQDSWVSTPSTPVASLCPSPRSHGAREARAGLLLVLTWSGGPGRLSPCAWCRLSWVSVAWGRVLGVPPRWQLGLQQPLWPQTVWRSLALPPWGPADSRGVCPQVGSPACSAAGDLRSGPSAGGVAPPSSAEAPAVPRQRGGVT